MFEHTSHIYIYGKESALNVIKHISKYKVLKSGQTNKNIQTQKHHYSVKNHFRGKVSVFDICGKIFGRFTNSQILQLLEKQKKHEQNHSFTFDSLRLKTEVVVLFFIFFSFNAANSFLFQQL